MRKDHLCGISTGIYSSIKRGDPPRQSQLWRFFCPKKVSPAQSRRALCAMHSHFGSSINGQRWTKLNYAFFRSLDIQRHAHAHRPKGTHVTTDRKLDLSRQDSWTYVGVLETLLVQVSSSKTPQIYTRHRFYTSNNWSDHGALCFTALYSYGLEVIHGSAQHRSDKSGHHWDEHEKCACKRKI